MAKAPSKNSGAVGQAYRAPKAPGTYKDRNIAGMAPKKADALIPSDSVPVKLHNRMAGGG